MFDFKTLILKYLKNFIEGNLLGTLVDSMVLWLFLHLVFNSYVGQVIPIHFYDKNSFFSIFLRLVSWKIRTLHLSKELV